MPARRADRLGFASVLSHLGVMVAVSAVMGSWSPAWPSRSRRSPGWAPARSRRHGLPPGRPHRGAARRSAPACWPPTAACWPPSTTRTGSTSPSARVAPIMKKAIIAIEDYRFYEHGALDLKGTLRAFISNQAADGVVQGGSSITQQMVKMTLINQADDRRGAGRDAGGHLRAEDQRAALRGRVRGEVRQGLDPRALPQHRLLRRRGVRHRGRRPALLLQPRGQADPAPGGAARRPGEEPDRLRPDQRQGRGQRATRHRPGPDGRAERDLPARRPDAAAKRGLGLDITAARNGCVSSFAPFFCDYTREYLLADEDLGKTREGASSGCCRAG